LSDALGIIAQPHLVLDAKTGNPIDVIGRLCVEHGITTIVIGLPVTLSGEEGPAAERARELGLRVGEATECEIVFYDERFTTVQAEAAMLEAGVKRRKRRGVVDKVAAAVMLQGYLDRNQRDDR
jgi:putative Holliday junction resolvase